MKYGRACDSAMEAMGWAMYVPTGHPGSRLTLMWIAQTLMGGSQTSLDGIVTIDVEKIAEETQQTVEDVQDAILIFRALGLIVSRWVDDDPRDPEPRPGRRDFLATDLQPDSEDFEEVMRRMQSAASQTDNGRKVRS